MTKKAIDVEAGTVTFDFENGKVIVIELAKCTGDALRRLPLHGISQKAGDSYAGAGDSADPAAYAEAAVLEVQKQLYAGEWRATSAGGPRTSDLATAISRLNGKPVEEVVESLGKATDEQKKELRKHPQIAATLAAIKAENAAKRAATLAEKAAGGAGELPAFG